MRLRVGVLEENWGGVDMIVRRGFEIVEVDLDYEGLRMVGDVVMVDGVGLGCLDLVLLLTKNNCSVLQTSIFAKRQVVTSLRRSFHLQKAQAPHKTARAIRTPHPDKEVKRLNH